MRSVHNRYCHLLFFRCILRSNLEEAAKDASQPSGWWQCYEPIVRVVGALASGIDACSCVLFRAVGHKCQAVLFKHTNL